MGAAKLMTVKTHKLRSPLLIRIEDALVSSPPPPPIYSHLTHVFAALTTISPSPSTPDYPPIFISPLAAPAPSPFPATLASSSGHSSVPKAAIVGGSVAGAVVILAVTATVVSTVAGKAALSCIFVPVLRLLTSLGGAVASQCSKLNSLCSNLQDWTRRKDGSDKTGNTAGGGKDGDNIDLYEVLAGSYSPEAAKKAETTAATVYSLATSPLIHDVAVKAHDGQLGTSAQAFLTSQVCDFAEGELKKQTESMMQPLTQNLTKAQGYFESLYTATSNASDELKALKSSAHTYLHDAKSSAEQISNFDVAVMLEEARKVGAEKIKNSSIAIEYAAEMKRLQKLQNEAVVIDEEAVLNRLLGKAPPNSSNHAHEITLNDAGVDRGGPVYIVETPSDANTLLQEELVVRSIAPYHVDTDQQHISRVSQADATHKLDESSTTISLSSRSQRAMSISNREALVPTASAGAQDAIKPIAGAIVPVPTKAITPLPAGTMEEAAKKPTWQLTQQGKGGKRPTNLGHVSFSCEISARSLFLFTSCKAGGSYGSPPHSHATREDLNHDYHNNNHVEMQQLEHVRSNNMDVSNYYRNSMAPYPMSYGGNHVGLLASSSAPIKHHYSDNVQNHQPTIANSISSHHMPPPNTSMIMSTPHNPLDYGSPFDGVL